MLYGSAIYLKTPPYVSFAHWAIAHGSYLLDCHLHWWVPETGDHLPCCERALVFRLCVLLNVCCCCIDPGCHFTVCVHCRGHPCCRVIGGGLSCVYHPCYRVDHPCFRVVSVVIPSSEWGRFCYAHTVDGKKPDRRRKYLVALLA